MISVIIPIYNAKAYINNLVNSLKSQTCRDFEIIFIDDGSSDGSAELLDEIAVRKLDFPVSVIHQQNAGVSSARNRGMQEANGEFVCFLDADDTPSNDYFELLANAAEKLNVNVVMGFITRSEEKLALRENFTPEILKSDDFLREFLYRGIRFSICAGIYRKKTLEDLELTFPIGYKYSEDVYLLWQLFARQNYVGVLPCAIYYYYNNPYSAMNRKMDSNRLQAIELMKKLEPIIEKYSPNVADEFKRFVVARHHWSILWQAACCFNTYKDFVEYQRLFDMKGQLKKLFNYPSKRVSLSARLFCAFPWIYYHFIRIYKKNNQ